MDRRVAAIVACLVVLAGGEYPGTGEQSPRITIETATGDALFLTSSSNHAWRVGPNSGSGAGFGVHDDTAGATRLKIDLSGNVGIGTTSPQHPLDVAGRIRSSSGGFVFPDGTMQATAATGGLAAGAGLTLAGNVLSIAGAGVQSSHLADGAVTSAKLSSDAMGGVQQVVRGVVTFLTSNSPEVTQSFSPAIDPAKSYVVIGPPVFLLPTPAFENIPTKLGAVLLALTATTITLAVDSPGLVPVRIHPCRVSFQIIQFK